VAVLSPEAEAEHLVRLHGGPEAALRPCLDLLTQQFNVIQARSQLLLSLATITLTITGFSGPSIARTNLFARLALAGGISLVLASVIVLLLGTLRIRWVTQFDGPGTEAILIDILRERNRRTRYYQAELVLIVIGLFCYVISLVTFLIHWQGP